MKGPLSYHQKMNLQDVFDLYENKLHLVELKIMELFRNKAPVIPLIGSYITSSGGKRLRPLFHLNAQKSPLPYPVVMLFLRHPVWRR